jgi:putative ABC transport system permease protein
MKPAFSVATLSRRSLAFHLRSYALVGLACAVACAVVTGALLVGDSVRGSLVDRVEERLGAVDHALVASRFFRGDLAAELAAAPEARGAISKAVPLVVLSGTVEHAGSRRRAAGVNVLGVPGEFWGLWDASSLPAPPGELSMEGRQALVSASLADALGARPGDALLVSFEKRGEIPAEHAMGRRGEEAGLLRLELGRVLLEKGPALFDLELSQRPARNVFLPLETLARALERKGLVNAILVAAPRGGPAAGPGVLEDALRKSWKLEDAGLILELRPERGIAALESRELLLPPPVAEAALSAARAAGAESQEVLTYLASTLAVGGREIPYSTVTAVGGWSSGGSSPGDSSEGFEALPGLRPGEILLGAWAAEDLEARAGEALRMTYLAATSDERLEEKEAVLRVGGVVPDTAVSLDPGWTPNYPGISNARSLRQWDPPFPIDLHRIRDKDERYWDLHRAAPKAFLSLDDGRRFWSSRFGSSTSIRLRGKAGASLEETAGKFREELLRGLDPARLGLSFLPVKSQALQAARAGTDFGVLFLSFSFFLIASALILLAMVFRLACERRSRELGILLACGFSPGALRKTLLLDGLFLTVPGIILGLAGGLGYAAALTFGLRVSWAGAVSAPFLSLHAGAASLLAGGGVTALLSAVTFFLVARRVARARPWSLLSAARLSGAEGTRRKAAPRRRLAVAAGAALLAAGLFAAGSFPGGLTPQAAFFGGGACLLAAGICLVDFQLRRPPRGIVRGAGIPALARMGIRYGGAAPSRSLLTVTLVASATFVILSIAALRRSPGEGPPRKTSGDGGFALVARTSVPLTAALSTTGGRSTLGLSQEAASCLAESKVFAFRLRPGDDASCLNLFQPRSPRVLGVPTDFIARGGFAWAGSLAETVEEKDNPWRLLDARLPDGAVPAVGDASTVTWNLHSGLGEEIEVSDERGGRLKLRIVGLLSHSLFQGELLIGESHFLERFPGIQGHRFFLLEADPSRTDLLSRKLEEELARYGFDADRVSAWLESYEAVENTYLSTFQLLGWLGLLLGTVGLGAVLSRSVNERRGELALLRAVGYSSRAVAWMVLGETAWLLFLGLGVGGLAAVSSLIPSALAGRAGLSWGGIAGNLLVTFAVGLTASILALRSALRAPLIPALRRE